MKELLEKYKNLENDVSQEMINKTAEDLKRRQYMPPFLIDVKDFFYITKEEMLNEYNRVLNLSLESEELKSVVGIENTNDVKKLHLNTLLNQYKLLCELRKGSAEAWDTINELYEDD